MRPDNELGTISAAFCLPSGLLVLWEAETGAWVCPALDLQERQEQMVACWHELGLWVGDNCRSHPGRFKAHGIDDLLSNERKQVAVDRLCVEETHTFLSGQPTQNLPGP